MSTNLKHGLGVVLIRVGARTNLAWWRATVFAAATVSAAFIEASLSNRSYGLGLNEVSDPSAVVRVGGNKYNIPREYFASQPLVKEEEQHVLLGFQLPAFDPLQLSDRRPGTGASMLLVLLQTAIFGSSSPELPADPMERAFYAYAHQASRSGLLSEPDGLHYTTDKYGQSVAFREDEHQKLVMFIVCRRQLLPGEGVKARSSPYPGCDHFFLSGRLLVKLNYDRSWLPQWRQTQAHTQAILDSYLIQGSAR